MITITFNNLKDLEKHLKQQINDTLRNEVAEEIKDTMQREVRETVYSKYNPTFYKRRYGNGGLSDRRNIRANLTDDGVLQVTNETPLNDEYGSAKYGRTINKSLAEIIEYGNGYDFHNGGAYEEPRPFMSNTTEDLKYSKSHVKALKAGLRNKGIDVQ